MIDLSLSKNEAKSYICNVEPDLEGTFFHINYADGHSEVGSCINQHNYECYLKRMEEQYYKYQEVYLKVIGKNACKKIINMATSTILTVASFYLLFNLDIHLAIKIILSILVSIGNLIFCFIEKYKLVIMDEYVQQVDIMKYYLEHKDEFVKGIYNEELGKEENVSLINLNNIDVFKTMDSFQSFVEQIKDLDGNEILSLSR